MKKRKGRLSTIILILVFVVGLSLLLYPTLSDYWNSFHQSRAIAAYAEEVAGMDDGAYQRLLEEAAEYNASLPERTGGFTLTDEEKARYESMLRAGGSGVMGYIEIPAIDCTLPIYHGTSESTLQTAIGHLEWSSLPVGGESSHCVLSGHRGLPSAKLFTNLDKLAEGDVFLLRVLDETLTYQVDQILIVEPEDTSALQIVRGEDYCTLMTCTPYGINTHRLLVRGHRVDNAQEAETARVTADAIQIETLFVAPAVAIPMLLLLLIVLLIGTRRKKRRR